MVKLIPKKMLFGGIGAVATGALLEAGAKIADYLLGTALSLPSVGIVFYVFAILVGSGVIAIVVAVSELRRKNPSVIPPTITSVPSQPSFDKALVRAERLRKVTSDLDVHYKGVIDRMSQLWDYQPRDSGEQIFTKGTTSPDQTIPFGLEEDKKHLKEYREPWEPYSNGPIIYAEAKRLEEETRQLVKEYLISPVNGVEPPGRLLDKFTDDIITRVDRRNRGQYARDFEAGLMTVKSQNNPASEHPAIDTELLDPSAWWQPKDYRSEWDLSKAEKLKELMNKVLSAKDVADLVKKKREAWDAVSRNKNEFLRALGEKIIRPAVLSNYQTPELNRGVCDNCTHLKDERDSLLGT